MDNAQAHLLKFKTMSKILPIFLLTLLLGACSGKWDHVDSEMPAELRELNETILNEQLGFLKEDSQNLDALFEVAFRYQQLGDWKKAVKYYEKVREQAPADFPTLNNLAYIYEEMGDYAVAAEYTKLLYEANPSNIEVIKDTVRILLEADDALNAEHALQNFEALSIDPANPDPYIQELVAELLADIAAAREGKQ